MKRRLLTILSGRVFQKITKDGCGRYQACRCVRFLILELPETTEVVVEVQIRFARFKAFNFLEGWRAHSYNNIALRKLNATSNHYRDLVKTFCFNLVDLKNLSSLKNRNFYATLVLSSHSDVP